LESRLEIRVKQELIQNNRLLCTNTSPYLFTIDQFSSFPLDIISVTLRYLRHLFVERCRRMQHSMVHQCTRHVQRVYGLHS